MTSLMFIIIFSFYKVFLIHFQNNCLVILQQQLAGCDLSFEFALVGVHTAACTNSWSARPNFYLFLLCKFSQCCFRSKGVILNISSASGMYPLPLLTIYSASKVRVSSSFHSFEAEIVTISHPNLSSPRPFQAFVDFFSRGLQEEYRRQGIIIQVRLPPMVLSVAHIESYLK